MADEDRFQNIATGMIGPLTRYARIAISNGDRLPFAPRAILMTASGQARIHFKNGSSSYLDFQTGELAAGVWHPMRADAIDNNDVEVIIGD